MGSEENNYLRVSMTKGTIHALFSPAILPSGIKLIGLPGSFGLG